MYRKGGVIREQQQVGTEREEFSVNRNSKDREKSSFIRKRNREERFLREQEQHVHVYCTYIYVL